MTADPLCTCGHPRPAHSSITGRCFAPNSTHDECCCGCPAFTSLYDDDPEPPAPGSLEDILGVWHDQGPFPLRSTADVALLIDEIMRLRARVAELLEFIGEPVTRADLHAAINRQQAVPVDLDPPDGFYAPRRDVGHTPPRNPR